MRGSLLLCPLPPAAEEYLQRCSSAIHLWVWLLSVTMETPSPVTALTVAHRWYRQVLAALGSVGVSTCVGEGWGSVGVSTCMGEGWGLVGVSTCVWEGWGSVGVSTCVWEGWGLVGVSMCLWEGWGLVGLPELSPIACTCHIQHSP